MTIIINLYVTLKQALVFSIGEQPTCDLWDETARRHVDSYCENKGFIHELVKTTTPTPEGLLPSGWVVGGRLSLDFMTKKDFFDFFLSAQNVCDCRSYVSCVDYSVQPCPTDYDSYFNPCTQR